jgi:hypothetical protein
MKNRINRLKKAAAEGYTPLQPGVCPQPPRRCSRGADHDGTTQCGTCTKLLTQRGAA